MEYKEIEGVVYCAYGIDISESTNIELLEKIFEDDFRQLSEEEYDEYVNEVKKDKAKYILDFFEEHSGGIDEAFHSYFYKNEKLNPHDLFLDYSKNVIYYGPSYPWYNKDRKDITLEMVEETFDILSKEFGLDNK